MIQALFEKELRQHGSMILLFWLLIAIGLLLLTSNDVLSSVGGSGFFLISWLLFVLFPLATLVLGNALIATEYRQKTQVFLEGLPLPRWKMVAVKYFCGLVVALLTALMPLGFTIANNWSAEALDGSFLTLLLTKTILWAWFAWATIFPFSLLGRYRMIVGLTVVIGLMFAQNAGGVPVNRFGPFELIGDQFAYERVEYPLQAIGVTIGLVIVLTCAGFSMALARDASLATMLSERMSTREKMAMIALGLAGMMVCASLAERVEQTDPLDLPDSVDIVDAGVSVSIAAAVATPTDAEREAMQTHGQAAAQLAREMADFLQIKKLPPLFLIHRRDLKAGEFQDGEIDSRQGCLVRLNILETAATDNHFRSHVIEKLLDANQHYRLSSDSRGWILQGFAYWWPRRTSSDLPTLDEIDVHDSHDGQQHTANQVDIPAITERDLLRWKKYRQSLPAGSANWFAAKIIDALWSKDKDSCHEFLVSTLGYSAPHDVRATLHDWWYDIPTMTRKILKTDLQDLAATWNQAAQVERLPAKSHQP